ncbi:hypothetical protein DIPPA_35799 [Diplonema papillatum]|nr:hypothetical protein DIPPA_35799 [Diplonema papillatum]KAJ9455405.1 hypothetical protein DIPPA_35799 [Diplonema papillatum]
MKDQRTDQAKHVKETREKESVKFKIRKEKEATLEQSARAKMKQIEILEREKFEEERRLKTTLQELKHQATELDKRFREIDGTGVAPSTETSQVRAGMIHVNVEVESVKEMLDTLDERWRDEIPVLTPEEDRACRGLKARQQEQQKRMEAEAETKKLMEAKEDARKMRGAASTKQRKGDLELIRLLLKAKTEFLRHIEAHFATIRETLRQRRQDTEESLELLRAASINAPPSQKQDILHRSFELWQELADLEAALEDLSERHASDIALAQLTPAERVEQRVQRVLDVSAPAPGQVLSPTSEAFSPEAFLESLRSRQTGKKKTDLKHSQSPRAQLATAGAVAKAKAAIFKHLAAAGTEGQSDPPGEDGAFDEDAPHYYQYPILDPYRVTALQRYHVETANSVILFADASLAPVHVVVVVAALLSVAVMEAREAKEHTADGTTEDELDLMHASRRHLRRQKSVRDPSLPAAKDSSVPVATGRSFARFAVDQRQAAAVALACVAAAAVASLPRLARSFRLAKPVGPAAAARRAGSLRFPSTAPATDSQSTTTTGTQLSPTGAAANQQPGGRRSSKAAEKARRREAAKKQRAAGDGGFNPAGASSADETSSLHDSSDQSMDSFGTTPTNCSGDGNINDAGGSDDAFVAAAPADTPSARGPRLAQKRRRSEGRRSADADAAYYDRLAAGRFADPDREDDDFDAVLLAIHHSHATPTPEPLSGAPAWLASANLADVDLADAVKRRFWKKLWQNTYGRSSAWQQQQQQQQQQKKKEPVLLAGLRRTAEEEALKARLRGAAGRAKPREAVPAAASLPREPRVRTEVVLPCVTAQGLPSRSAVSLCLHLRDTGPRNRMQPGPLLRLAWCVDGVEAVPVLASLRLQPSGLLLADPAPAPPPHSPRRKSKHPLARPAPLDRGHQPHAKVLAAIKELAALGEVALRGAWPSRSEAALPSALGLVQPSHFPEEGTGGADATCSPSAARAAFDSGGPGAAVGRRRPEARRKLKPPTAAVAAVAHYDHAGYQV